MRSHQSPLSNNADSPRILRITSFRFVSAAPTSGSRQLLEKILRLQGWARLSSADPPAETCILGSIRGTAVEKPCPSTTTNTHAHSPPPFPSNCTYPSHISALNFTPCRKKKTGHRETHLLPSPHLCSWFPSPPVGYSHPIRPF